MEHHAEPSGDDDDRLAVCGLPSTSRELLAQAAKVAGLHKGPQDALGALGGSTYTPWSARSTITRSTGLESLPVYAARAPLE